MIYQEWCSCFEETWWYLVNGIWFYRYLDFEISSKTSFLEKVITSKQIKLFEVLFVPTEYGCEMIVSLRISTRVEKREATRFINQLISTRQPAIMRCKDQEVVSCPNYHLLHQVFVFHSKFFWTFPIETSIILWYH